VIFCAILLLEDKGEETTAMMNQIKESIKFDMKVIGVVLFYGIAGVFFLGLSFVLAKYLIDAGCFIISKI